MSERPHNSKQNWRTHMETGTRSQEKRASTICVGSIVLCWVKQRSQNVCVWCGGYFLFTGCFLLWDLAQLLHKKKLCSWETKHLCMYTKVHCAVFWHWGWTETFKDQLLWVISFTHNVHIPLGPSHFTQKLTLDTFIFSPPFMYTLNTWLCKNK